MKKRFLTLLLPALPIMTVGIESMPNSVTVFWVEAQKQEFVSFFGTLSDGTLPMAMSMTGMLTGLIFGFALAYTIAKKIRWLSLCKWACVLAIVFASSPLLMQNGPMIIPSALVYLLLAAEWILCMYLEKQEQKAAGEIGKKLKKNKNKK